MANISLIQRLGRPASANGWRAEAVVRSTAGAMVLASLGLAQLDRHWLWLAAFVGVNLLQSGLTGWCLLSNLLSLGRNRD